MSICLNVEKTRKKKQKLVLALFLLYTWSVSHVVLYLIARVGKTSLSCRFVHGNFDKNMPSTVDASYLEKPVMINDGKKVKLTIWDTAGQEKYHALAKNYYQGASGALLVYDVTDEDSFQRAQQWHKELIHEIGRDAPIILAGNKCDIINRTVAVEDADNFARSKGIEHVSTSAANGNNVDYIFTTLAESKYYIIILEINW